MRSWQACYAYSLLLTDMDGWWHLCHRDQSRPSQTHRCGKHELACRIAKLAQGGVLTSFHSSHTDKAACLCIFCLTCLVSASIDRCRLCQNGINGPDTTSVNYVMVSHSLNYCKHTVTCSNFFAIHLAVVASSSEVISSYFAMRVKLLQ